MEARESLLWAPELPLLALLEAREETEITVTRRVEEGYGKRNCDMAVVR